MIMSRMLVSSSCVVFLLCLLHVCNGRHVTSIDNDHLHAMDDNAKLLSRSTIKGFKNEPAVTVLDDLNLIPNPVSRGMEDDLNLNKTKSGKSQTNRNVNYDHHMKQTADSESTKIKNDMIKDQTVMKKYKEEVVHDRHRKSITFRVPSKDKRVHQQQPGFNLDYSPPKTHPPSHN